MRWKLTTKVNQRVFFCFLQWWYIKFHLFLKFKLFFQNSTKGESIYFKEFPSQIEYLAQGIFINKKNVLWTVVKLNFVNLISLVAILKISKAHFWVCLDVSWRHDLGNYIWYLPSSSLVLFVCSASSVNYPVMLLHTLLPWCSALKPAGHGLDPPEPWVKINLPPLSCGC